MSLYRVTADMRQQCTDNSEAEYPAHSQPLGALTRYAVGKTVRELLSHSDYDPVQQRAICVSVRASGLLVTVHNALTQISVAPEEEETVRMSQSPQVSP